MTRLMTDCIFLFKEKVSTDTDMLAVSMPIHSYCVCVHVFKLKTEAVLVWNNMDE